MINKVSFNGTEYTSAEEMPPDVRAAYDRALELAAQDQRGNLLGGKVNVKFSTKVRFAHNGKVYESPDQMPPDVKVQYDKAMEQIDKNHNGVPDILEGNTTQTAPEDPPDSPEFDRFATTDHSSMPQMAPSQPVIAPDAPSKRLWLLMAGIVIVAILIGMIALGLVVIQH